MSDQFSGSDSGSPGRRSGWKRNGKQSDRFDQPDVLGREPPHNIEAEEGLIASCILDGGRDILTTCMEQKLRPDAFYRRKHQLIFEAMVAIYGQDMPVDEILLAEQLEKKGNLEEVGGYAAISELAARIETSAHAHHWLKIVLDKSLLRKLIRASTKILDDCHAGELDLPAMLETAEQQIFHISQDRVSDSATHISDSINEAVTLINTLVSRKGDISGVSSGLTDLDRMTFGFHPTQMIVVAARPSVGKTSLAMNFAEAAIMPRNGEPVPTLVFSLEMGADQLAFRLLCSDSRVNAKKIMDGFMSREDNKAISASARKLQGAPLWIDDAAQVTILEIRAKARRLHAKQQLGLVIIDYLQLVSGTDPRTPREQQIAEISRGVKAMAKELKLPVIVLSQLNRESEKERRAPRLSDLRESGSIEQDADVVMMLHRKAREGKEASPEDPRERDLIIAKQRNGPVGTVTLAFVPEITRFENYAPDRPV